MDRTIHIYIYEVCSKLFYRVVPISMLPGCLPGNQPFASGYLPGIGVFWKSHLKMVGKLYGKMFGKLLNKQSGKSRIKNAKQRHMQAGTYYTSEAARSRRDCRDSQNIPRTMDCIRTTASVQQKLSVFTNWTAEPPNQPLPPNCRFTGISPSGYLPVTFRLPWPFFLEPGWAEDWQEKTFRQRAGRQLYKQSGKEGERERGKETDGRQKS